EHDASKRGLAEASDDRRVGLSPKIQLPPPGQCGDRLAALSFDGYDLLHRHGGVRGTVVREGTQMVDFAPEARHTRPTRVDVSLPKRLTMLVKQLSTISQSGRAEQVEKAGWQALGGF